MTITAVIPDGAVIGGRRGTMAVARRIAMSIPGAGITPITAHRGRIVPTRCVVPTGCVMRTGREMSGRRVPADGMAAAAHMTATARMAPATTATTGVATAPVLCERRRASQDRPQYAGRQKKAFALNAHGCHLP
jgi:hypothetical protein